MSPVILGNAQGRRFNHSFQGDRKNILFYIQASVQYKAGDEVHQERHKGFNLKLDVGTK